MPKNPNHSDHNIPNTEDIRRALGKAFWGIVEYYGFKRDEQAVLLGISPNNRSVLAKLQEKLQIPESELAEIVTRQLLGIHKSLSILYPRADQHEGNYRLKKSFFNRPNKNLSDLTPLDYLLQDRMRPLSRVTVIRRNLDIIRTAG
jgi:hypothetical protein